MKWSTPALRAAFFLQSGSLPKIGFSEFGNHAGTLAVAVGGRGGRFRLLKNSCEGMFFQAHNSY